MNPKESKCRICGHTAKIYPAIECPKCGYHMPGYGEETVLLSITGYLLGRYFTGVRSGAAILTNRRIVCVLDNDSAFRMFSVNIIGGILGVIICRIIFGDLAHGTLAGGIGFAAAMLINRCGGKNIGFSLPLSDIVSIEDENNKWWKSFAVRTKNGTVRRFSSGQKTGFIEAVRSLSGEQVEKPCL